MEFLQNFDPKLQGRCTNWDGPWCKKGDGVMLREYSFHSVTLIVWHCDINSEVWKWTQPLESDHAGDLHPGRIHSPLFTPPTTNLIPSFENTQWRKVKLMYFENSRTPLIALLHFTFPLCCTLISIKPTLTFINSSRVCCYQHGVFQFDGTNMWALRETSRQTRQQQFLKVDTSLHRELLVHAQSRLLVQSR